MFVVAPGRLELPTCGLGNHRSIHLSYGAAWRSKHLCKNIYTILLTKNKIGRIVFYSKEAQSILFQRQAFFTSILPQATFGVIWKRFRKTPRFGTEESARLENGSPETLVMLMFFPNPIFSAVSRRGNQASPPQPSSNHLHRTSSVPHCRICHCSEDSPCRLNTGDACCWVSIARDLCSNPACIRRAAKNGGRR